MIPNTSEDPLLMPLNKPFEAVGDMKSIQCIARAEDVDKKDTVPSPNAVRN